MRIYLTSYRIPSIPKLEELLGRSLKGLSVGVIINAKDGRPKKYSKIKLKDLIDYLKKLGTKPELIDLYFYKDHKKDLLSELSKYELLYAAGGNTFSLRLSMHISGFKTALETYLINGGVYLGESAGARVAGNTLKTAQKDEDEIWVKNVIYDGLNLVKHNVVPHADNPKYLSRTKIMLKEGKNLLVLNDNQAYIQSGEKNEIITGDRN